MRHLIPAGDMEEVRRNLGASTGPLNPCDSSSCWHACCAGDVPKLGQIPVEPHVICAKLLAASCAFADMTPGATPICRNCHVPKFSRPTSMVPVIAALVQAGHLTKSKRPDPWNSFGPEDLSSTQGSSRSQSQDREQTLQQNNKAPAPPVRDPNRAPNPSLQVANTQPERHCCLLNPSLNAIL